MHKSAPQPTSIRQIIQYYNAERLNFYPDYQRRSDRWDSRRKKDLLFSLLNSNEYVIPNVYLHSNSPKARQLEVFDVVDGKQRLSTIINFVTGRKIRRPDGIEESLHPLRIGDDYAPELLLRHKDEMLPLLGKSFAELEENEQNLFLDVRINIVFMVDYDVDVLRNVFQLMQAGRSLTPQEKVLSLNNPNILKARELYRVYSDGLTRQKRSNQDGYWIHGISEMILVAVNSDINLQVKNAISVRYKDEVLEAGRDKVSNFLRYMTEVMDYSTLGYSEFIKAYTVRFFTTLVHIWVTKGEFSRKPADFRENWEALAPRMVDLLMKEGVSPSLLPRLTGRAAHAKIIIQEFDNYI